MLLTVHDELVFEVPLDERDEMEALVRDVMESAVELQGAARRRPRLRPELGRDQVAANERVGTPDA